MAMLVLQTALLILVAFLLGYLAFFQLAGLVRPAAPAYPAIVRAPKRALPEPAPAPVETKPDGYRWAAWRENGKIVLGRSIPSESVRAELLSLVRRVHAGVRIEDRMKALEGEPEGWWIAASSAVRALGDLSQGRVSLDDLVMTIEGRAATNEGYDRLKLTGVGLEGAAFTVHSTYLERPSAQRPPLPLPPLPKRPTPVRLPEVNAAAPVEAEPKPDVAPSVPDAAASPTYAEIAARLAALPKDASFEQRADVVGTRPPALSAPRGGAADDLKRIKGVGPKNEKVLNGLGVFHFDQIEAWTPEVVAWVEAYIAFPGRITREDWIAQCAVLAKGGETERSNTADGGEAT